MEKLFESWRKFNEALDIQSPKRRDPTYDGFRFDPNSTTNEGRYRLKDPKLFKKFWRKPDKNEEGISYVVGMLKNGKFATQAIRFNTNIWHEEKAGQWWEQNKGRFQKVWTNQDWENLKEGIESDIEAQFPGVDLWLTHQPEDKGLVVRKIVLPKEKREQGTGTKVMDKIAQWADKNGVTLALTPSPDFGGSKTRLVKFYKRFGFDSLFV